MSEPMLLNNLIQEIEQDETQHYKYRNEVVWYSDYQALEKEKLQAGYQIGLAEGERIGHHKALEAVGKIYYRFSTGEITLKEFADELTKLKET